MRLTKQLILILTILTLAILLTACSNSNGISGDVTNSYEKEEHGEEEEHECTGTEHSVHVDGTTLKTMTVQEVADYWGIDSNKLLDEIVNEFNLIGSYDVDTVVNDMNEFEDGLSEEEHVEGSGLEEGHMQAKTIKDIAEDILQERR